MDILYKVTIPAIWGKPTEMSMLLPAKPVWCGCCHGSGKRSWADNRGFDINQMIEDDPDFGEEYWSGKTDEICQACDGKGAVPVPNHDALNDEQKAFLVEVERLETEYESDLKVQRAENGWC